MSNLISYDEIPADNVQLKDNPYIIKYHRRPTLSLTACIQSMTTMHCETANFWTHLIPALMALLFIMSNFSPYPISFIRYHHFDLSTLTLVDRIVLSFSMFGIMVCFGTSSVFHVFACHKEWAGTLNEFDLMGIMYMNSSLIAGFDYFKFYNSRFVQNGTVVFTVIVGGMSILIVRSLRDPSAKAFRVLVYVTATLFLLIPAFTSLYLDSHVKVDAISNNLIKNAAFYSLLGGVFYASKLPEKLFPGYFDLIGSSHMCMHVCTALGTFYLYETIIRTATFAYENIA